MPTSEQLDGFDDNESGANEETQDQQFDALSRALARSVFESVLGRLRKDVVGHDDVLQHLALVAAQHTALKSGGRVLLVGPSGCGKTTLGLLPVQWTHGSATRSCVRARRSKSMGLR